MQNHIYKQYNSVRRMETLNRPYDAVRDIFRSFFYQLVKAIQPVYLEVSNKLYSDRWISQRHFTAGESSELAATLIVTEVETQLNLRWSENSKRPNEVLLELCYCLETVDAVTVRTVIQSMKENLGDVKKGKAPAGVTDEHAKDEEFGEGSPEKAEILAQFEEFEIQMDDTMAESQPLINTHEEESNDSVATTTTSEGAGAEWHAELCSFKQQTQEKFKKQAKAICDLKQQNPTKELASKTLEILKKFNEAQAKLSHSVEQLRTEHGKILDEIPAIKSQLEKIQQDSQVSQETQAHLIRLVSTQTDMIAQQLKEKLQN